jgi:hypothetical protein
MDTKTLIVRAAALVAVISGLFGGFLLNITPPDNGGNLISEFSQGIYSSILLCLILLLWAYSAYFPNQISPQKWVKFCAILIGIFFVSSIGYFYLFQTFTYLEPLTVTEYFRHIHGNTLTTAANEWLSNNPNLGKKELLEDYVYNQDAIWQEGSTHVMQSLFFAIYLIVSTSLSAAIVCLAELICNAKPSAGKL